MEDTRKEQEAGPGSVADFFGEPVATYTRAEAIADGVLVDLTEWASAESGFMGGFSVPVAVTAGVWDLVDNIPARVQGFQDVRGRAHDLLWMASLAARRGNGSETQFAVLMDVAASRRRKHVFTLAIGPDDNGGPCVTVMLPGKD